MPRAAKGPRLYAQPERRDETGRIIERAVWVIRDGPIKLSTGISVEDDRGPPGAAERALGDYIASKHAAPRQGSRPIDAIAVADVISIYVADKGQAQARPLEVAGRAKALLSYWGDKLLGQVTGSTCAEFIAEGGTRRQLEDLRAAIGYHLEQGLHREIVGVALPPKGEPRDRWLTRSEAARLIWAAWRYREVQKGHPTGRRSRRHVARFILVAVYTGTRAGAVCGAALEPTEGAGWINLDSGVFYRRPQGERETKKRKTPVRLPPRLLAHLRRWKDKGICRRFAVEWNGEPVRDVDKAFRNAVRDAGLTSDVTPHTLKHTAITWAMHNRMSKEDAPSFFGTTIEVIERVYWHHSPDFQAEAAATMGKRPRQFPDRNAGNKREQNATEPTNVIDLVREA